MDVAGPNRITQIVVHHGEIVDALTVTYWTPRGSIVRHHGGSGGDSSSTISLSRMFKLLCSAYYRSFTLLCCILVNERIVGVYGHIGFQSTVYGETRYSFSPSNVILLMLNTLFCKLQPAPIRDLGQ